MGIILSEMLFTASNNFVSYFYDYEGTSMYESFSYPWAPEVIEVYVNNHGVVGLTWSNADTLTETINQNVKLLP